MKISTIEPIVELNFRSCWRMPSCHFWLSNMLKLKANLSTFKKALKQPNVQKIGCWTQWMTQHSTSPNTNLKTVKTFQTGHHLCWVCLLKVISIATISQVHHATSEGCQKRHREKTMGILYHSHLVIFLTFDNKRRWFGMIYLRRQSCRDIWRRVCLIKRGAESRAGGGEESSLFPKDSSVFTHGKQIRNQENVLKKFKDLRFENSYSGPFHKMRWILETYLEKSKKHF